MSTSSGAESIQLDRQPHSHSAPRWPKAVALARLRLRPTRRVECPYHSGGLGSLIDASLTTVKCSLAHQVVLTSKPAPTLASRWHYPVAPLQSDRRTYREHSSEARPAPEAPMFFTFPEDARWDAERQGVEVGVEI